ncbi:protein associated with UVRAG as autophagy enhancer [Phyllobates terribilis]|uniref:protein associated with UVRAG as autophagy enhancer n=1 Tax=Phyllobates terribilis TaxID=111132 RepID=UPI003CCAEE6E
MYVHTMTLTSYSSTKRVKKCARTAQVRRPNKHHLEFPPFLSPLSPLLSMPRTSTVLFTEDVLPRPAVIGVGASYGSYADSATAIKEILCSVLNLPRSINSTASVNAHPQDSDEEDLKDTNTGGNNMDSNCDPDGSPLLTTADNDIRFNRHTAAWDNTQLDSFNMSPLDPPTPITIAYVVPELDLSPYIQCEKCSDFILPESEFFPPQNLPINTRKEKRRFSSPGVTPHHGNPTYSSIVDESAFHLNETKTDTETSTVEGDKSVHRRSLSCSSLSKVTEPPPASSTEALPPSGENLFEPTVNLERENEHFLAADLFISVVEMMKSSWQSDQFQTEGGMYWLREDPEEPWYRRHKANSESATSVDSGYDGLVAVQSSPVETIIEEEEDDDSTTCEEDYDSDYVIIEIEDYEKLVANNNASNDTAARTGPIVSNTAEQTARNLYRAFRQQWTLIDVDGQLPAKLTTNTRSYTNMIPEEFESSVCLAEEIKRFRMMDDEDWSPPRFQVITTVHQYIRRDVIVASQNYFCAGCGTKVEPRYTSRLRYCDYLGKYFCDCCHHYSESSIPGRILSKWNFSKYYVSNFSKSVVDKIWDSHTFNVQSENPALYKKVKDLNRVKEVQQQLIHIRKLVTTCRFADSIIKAFEDVPSHLTEELHLFTMADLYNVKQKSLLPGLHELLALAVAHVEKCELCNAKGFFCEFCRNSDVIFPFQTDICRRCEDCKTCYHKECFKINDCPKCIRIKAREAQNNELSFTSSEEVDSALTT